VVKTPLYEQVMGGGTLSTEKRKKLDEQRVLSCVTCEIAQATHCEDMSKDVAFPPFSREDLVSACGIVETVPSRKTDQAGFVDPKLPPPFLPSKGVAHVGYLSGTPSRGRATPIITPI
jgi:hypothetical protein